MVVGLQALVGRVTPSWVLQKNSVSNKQALHCSVQGLSLFAANC